MRPINLLPPEQAKAARARRGTVLVLFIFLAFLVGIAFLGFLRYGERTDAEEATVTQQEVNDGINREIAALSDAADARDLYALRTSQLEEALTADVDWGRLLNDLGRVLPPRTWANSMAASAVIPIDDETSYGSITVSGVAFDYPDASTWFRTLDSTEWSAVGGAWVSSLNLGEVEGIPTVDFASSASLTDQALSNRSVTRVPEISE